MATKLSGMNRETYIIPKNSVKTIDYKDVEPNYFHIQNLGGTPLYFSSHTIPTTRIYDVKIDGGSIATFTDPYPQYEVYIFNPSATDDINIIMTSFKAPFDPVVLAQANKQISIGGTVETDGVIKGFNTALPAGANKIGKVDISSLPSIPAGSNKIGKVDVSSLPSIPAGANKIGKVDIASALPAGSAKIGRVDVDGVADIKTYSQNTNSKIDTIITLLQGIQSPEYNTSDIEHFYLECPTALNTTGNYLTPSSDNLYFSKLCSIENTGETNATLRLFTDFACESNDTMSLPAKSIKYLNMNCKITQISTPSNVTFVGETRKTKDIIKSYTLNTENPTLSIDNSEYPLANIAKIKIANNDDNTEHILPVQLSCIYNTMGPTVETVTLSSKNNTISNGYIGLKNQTPEDNGSRASLIYKMLFGDSSYDYQKSYKV